MTGRAGRSARRLITVLTELPSSGWEICHETRAEVMFVYTGRLLLERRFVHSRQTSVTDNNSQPSGHYMYHQFNIQQFYVLLTQCIYVFCVDLRTNSHYFPIQH